MDNDIKQEEFTEVVKESVTTEVKEPLSEETGVQPRKKVRVGMVFLSIVPVAILIAIQTITQVPFFGLAAVDVYKDGNYQDPESAIEATQKLLEVFVEKYALYAYMLYAIIGILVFCIWYVKGFVKKKPKVRFSQVFGVKSVVASIGIVLGLNFTITSGFIIVNQLLPEVMEKYAQLMNNAGLGSNLLITVIYAIFLGPVLEELCLRGVTYGYLERSGIKPIFIILISGVLFGAMHLNLVQGIYASVLGFFLGYLRYKYRSISLTIFAHILFNIMGTYGDIGLDLLGVTEAMMLIFGGVSLFILVFSVVLINNDKKAVSSSGRNP